MNLLSERKYVKIVCLLMKNCTLFNEKKEMLSDVSQVEWPYPLSGNNWIFLKNFYYSLHFISKVLLKCQLNAISVNDDPEI